MLVLTNDPKDICLLRNKPEDYIKVSVFSEDIELLKQNNCVICSEDIDFDGIKRKRTFILVPRKKLFSLAVRLTE